MNSKWWLASGVVVLGLAGLTQVAAQRASTGLAQVNGWHGDFASARAAAQRTGKPLMMVFRCEP